MKWSYFIRWKGKLIEQIMIFVKGLKAKDTKIVNYIRLDNAGENVVLKKILEKEGIEKNLGADKSRCSRTEWTGCVSLLHFGAEYKLCGINQVWPKSLETSCGLSVLLTAINYVMSFLEMMDWVLLRSFMGKQQVMGEF
jgi:hypothetical protein